MAIKATREIDLPDIGTVTLHKRKGTRTIRLSVDSRGQVRVTMPTWVPYEAGVQFARSRQEWIAEHLLKRGIESLSHGQVIGKSHRLFFEASPTVDKITSRVTASVVRVTHPTASNVTDTSVQSAAEKASIRALRAQAEAVLPDRLRQLADMFGFSYRSVQVKQLRGRWGSCDAQKNIVLNLFLMQLPWELVDYVLLHELTHTNVLRHGPDFWSAMARVLPDVQRRRKLMRNHHPIVGA